jgi:dihydrofolate reductase
MPKVVLFIATSLDGYIAGPDGEIDWLFHDADYGYTAFFDSVEVLVMGRKTYELSLSFGEWPYGDKPAYVFTRQTPPPDDRSDRRIACRRAQEHLAGGRRGTGFDLPAGRSDR